MKCEKCGFVSFDFNLTCPSCEKDLSAVRKKLGLNFDQPEVDFDEFFTGSSSAYKAATGATATSGQQQEAELDLEGGEEFEFTLDD
ncbi:MAG: hypothetical protein HY912_07970 [Desulfomonile tiedjei]|uniref:Uncharacterized protein n=1 Tax=Desulfomonile tiedjei TaxID=2358 RepID=A0A9D6V3N2_9BACT|nr:hypothetical protein [Desulfomonile tiedjei]